MDHCSAVKTLCGEFGYLHFNQSALHISLPQLRIGTHFQILEVKFDESASAEKGVLSMANVTGT